VLKVHKEHRVLLVFKERLVPKVSTVFQALPVLKDYLVLRVHRVHKVLRALKAPLEHKVSTAYSAQLVHKE
jgi:hypothetical protein